MLLSSGMRTREPISVAVTGANGGYGRTLLAQLSATPELIPTVLIDPDVVGMRGMLDELGSSREPVECATTAQTREAVIAGKVAVLANAAAIDWTNIDVLIEASGQIGPGSIYARDALRNDVHVVMVSKEVDTVSGIALGLLAAERGLSYLPADGDQPANLLRLIDWVAAVGLDIVAVGKSGEYDIVFDPRTGRVTQSGDEVHAPELADMLTLGDDVGSTLAARAEAVSGLKRTAAADACEMTVVAMRTGMAADVETMHYPVARIDELADVYAMREDGGILVQDGVVDVFSALRLPGEASFAGGVFAVVRTGDSATWELLRGKGHVVSRNGRYACLYWPYHVMGVETPLTVHAAADRLPGRQARPTVMLAARATKDLEVGTEFAATGHHHEIDSVTSVIVPLDPGTSPYYLLDHARLVRPVARGALIGLDDVTDANETAADLYRAGVAFRP